MKTATLLKQGVSLTSKKSLNPANKNVSAIESLGDYNHSSFFLSLNPLHQQQLTGVLPSNSDLVSSMHNQKIVATNKNSETFVRYNYNPITGQVWKTDSNNPVDMESIYFIKVNSKEVSNGHIYKIKTGDIYQFSFINKIKVAAFIAMEKWDNRISIALPLKQEVMRYLIVRYKKYENEGWKICPHFHLFTQKQDVRECLTRFRVMGFLANTVDVSI